MNRFCGYLLMVFLGVCIAGCGQGAAIDDAEINKSAPAKDNGRRARPDPVPKPTLVKNDRESKQLPAKPRRYDISLAEIRDHQQANSALLIDARSADQFARSHLVGSFNLPAISPDQHIEKLFKLARQDQLLIVYCSSRLCGAAETIHDYLVGHGFTNLRVYKPGWAVLAKADVERIGALADANAGPEEH